MKRVIAFISITILSLFMLTGCELLRVLESMATTNEVSIDDDTDYREILYLKATQSGYEGTYQEWLDSIKGDSIVIAVVENNLVWKYSQESDNSYRILFNLTSLKGDDGIEGPKGEQGDPGVGIESIEKIGTEGLVDTYLITYSNGNTYAFTVSNGATGEIGIGIASIQKVNTEGLVDTYLITYSNDNTFAFTINNGEKGENGVGVESIVKTESNGLIDNYLITYTNGNTYEFTIKNGSDGVGIESIEKISTEGLVDTYLITYTNDNTYSFTVTNGEVGNNGIGIVSIEKTNIEGLVDTYLLTYSDGSTFEFTINNGAVGPKGDTGKSAYEIYLEVHPEYTKDESEWLDDLVNGRLATKEEIKYTVSFDSKEGSPVSSQEVFELHNVVKPSDPTRPGYTFNGWFVDDEKWIFSGYIVTKDIELSAKWEANNYTIVFRPNGGSCNVNSMRVTFNEAFELPLATKDGYIFGGWYLNGEPYEDNIYKEPRSIELTAYWKPLYTITFNSNGGSEIDDLEVTGSKTVIELPTPIRDADIFIGWYLNEELVELPFTYEGVQEVIELKAMWREVAGDYEYTIDDNDDITITSYIGLDTDITIPSTINNKLVKKLGTNLFKNNQTIEKITLPNTITEIGDNAFSNMSSLEELIFNTGILSYGDSLLLGSSNLKKLTMEAENTMLLSLFDYDESNIPQDLYLILRYTNRYVNGSDGALKNLTENSTINLVFDDSWTDVYGFNNCHSLKSITLSSTIKTISNFENLRNLKALYINDIESYVQINSQNNYYYSYSGLLSYAHNLYLDGELVEELIIPDGVTKIGQYAFCGCRSIKRVLLPDSLIEIDGYAFANCYNIMYMELPDSVTTIKENAFYGAHFPLIVTENLINIENYAFNSSEIKKIYYRGAKAKWYQNVSNYVNSNIEIEYNCNQNFEYVNNDDYEYFRYDDDIYFIKCKNLNIEDFDGSNFEGGNVIYVYGGSFSGCSYLRTLSIPLHSIYDVERAVYRCDLGIIFGNSYYPGSYLASVYYGVCYYPASLKEITITNASRIYDYAFYGCTSLTSITIPDSVTSIGDSAFSNCKSLTSITISDSVTSIGNGAFQSCSSLTSITIPESVTSIGNVAFESCTSLESITIPDSVTSIGDSAFYNCSSLTSITIPDSVTSIGGSAFYNCSSLTSITIPESVTSIGGYAFYNCTSLTSIIIPDSVTSIGGYAFCSCSSLESITIPESVTSIGRYAFSNCSKIKYVFYGGTENKWQSIHIDSSNTSLNNKIIYDYAVSSLSYIKTTDYSYLLVNTDVIYDFKVLNKDIISFVFSDELLSASTINFYFNASNTSDAAFSNCKFLTSITIPDSVTSIGDRAFYNCSSLTSITIPDSVISIGNGAFQDCTSLTSITIPESVTSIGNSAFSNCTSLTSITIPDSVTSIGSGAFSSCLSLESIVVDSNNKKYDSRNNCNAIIETQNNFLLCGCKNTTIPESVTSIGYGAFEYCTSLESITIPSSVTVIGNYTFSNCTSLTSIIIPDSVTSIGDGTFYGCTSLTSITIPESVTSIGGYAFYSCSSLKNITIPKSVIKIGNNSYFGYNSAFNGETHLTHIFYCGNHDEYNQIERTPTTGTVYYYSEEEPAQEGNYWHYVDGVATPW